jgi:hypothetical protein
MSAGVGFPREGIHGTSSYRLPKAAIRSVRVKTMFSIMVATALCAPLNTWIGLDGYGVMVLGPFTVVPSLWMMRRFGRRIAAKREKITGRASTSFEFNGLIYLVGIPALAEMTIVFGDAFRSAPEWRAAGLVDFLLVDAWLAAVVLLVRVDIEYWPAAARAVGKKRQPGRQHSVAVVVVHGIGNQKASGPLEDVAGSVEQVLQRQAPQRVRVTRRPGTGTVPPHVEFQYEGRVAKRRVRQRVVVLEAFWADVESRPRRLQTLIWLVKSMPLMLLIAVAPDRRDLQKPSFTRLFYRLTFPVLVLLSLFQSSIRLLTLLLLVVVAASTAYRPTNLLGDVQIAATRDEEVLRILGVIDSAIDAAHSMASRVIVVGHSQGGFLSHQALELRAQTRGATERIEFIGIGSGLKPISLLKNFGGRRSIAGASALLLGALLITVSVVPFLLGVLLGQEGFLRWARSANKQLIDDGAAESRPVGGWHPGSWSHPAALLPDWGQAFALLLGIALCSFVGATARRHVRSLGQDLRCPRNVSRWTEITSSADTVGRLAWPRLADARVWNCPSLGQPLLDHISYYRRSSPVAWYLASMLFPALLGGTVPVLRQWANYLDIRIWQARALSTTLGLALLAAYAFDRLDPDAHGMRALLAQTRNPGIAFVGLLIITLVAPVLGMVDRHHLSAMLDLRPMPAPPELKRAPQWFRTLAAGFLFTFAGAVATSSHDLVRYPHMSATEVRLLAMAPAVTAALICLLAALLAVGYRFSLGRVSK